jgi:hypothetical protein
LWDPLITIKFHLSSGEEGRTTLAGNKALNVALYVKETVGEMGEFRRVMLSEGDEPGATVFNRRNALREDFGLC